MLLRSASFLLIFALALFGSASASGCSDAQVTAVRGCYMDFFAHYNFTAVPAYQDYVTAFRAFVTQGGVAALKQNCQWVQTRQQCILPADADCVTPQFWQSVLGDNTSDAYSFLSDFAVENYECTQAYDQMVRNSQCLAFVSSKHGDETMACANNFTVNSQQGFTCSLVTDYVNCFTKVYIKYCNLDAANFACTVAEVSMKTVIPTCNDSEPLCPQAQFRQFLGFHPRSTIL